FDQAISILEDGLGICRAKNILVIFRGIAPALGYAYALSGRVAEAVSLLEETVEHAAGTHGFHYAFWVACLGETYLLAGRRDDAVHLAGRALALARTHKERGHEAWALRLLGEIATHQDPPDVAPAAAHYRQALALAEELGMRPLQAHCHRGLGTLYATIGQPEQARAELSAAIGLYRAMDMTFWLPQTEAALAQVERP